MQSPHLKIQAHSQTGPGLPRTKPKLNFLFKNPTRTETEVPFCCEIGTQTILIKKHKTQDSSDKSRTAKHWNRHNPPKPNLPTQVKKQKRNPFAFSKSEKTPTLEPTNPPLPSHPLTLMLQSWGVRTHTHTHTHTTPNILYFFYSL